MSEAKIIFIFNGMQTIMQCNKKEKIKNILNRFGTNVEIDINKVYLLYDGNKINEELSFEELANKEDKAMNMMSIIIYEENNSIIENKLEKSKEIICPKCKENILIKLKDYKISMYNCKNKHRIEDIKINEFENTQIINISKIIFNQCKKINKGKTYENKFYRCIDCNWNLCPICNSKHNGNHNVIEFDKINYICNKHKEGYIKYCEYCKLNMCMKCESEHNNHKKILYGDISPNENESNKLKKYIDKFNNDINDIINKIKEIKKNIEIYSTISNNNIKNEHRNYEILQNKIEFISYNKKVINDIKEIINDGDIKNKFIKIMNIYNKMNKEIKEKDINKEKNRIDLFEEIKNKNKNKRERKDSKNNYKKDNEIEIKENSKIEINNKINQFNFFNKQDNINQKKESFKNLLNNRNNIKLNQEKNSNDNNINYSDYPEKMVDLINNIRKNPVGYADIIEDEIRYIVEENKNDPINKKLLYIKKVKVLLNRGVPAFRETANFLRSLNSLPPLIFNKEKWIPLPENEEELKNPTFLKEQVIKKRNNTEIDVFFKDLIKIPEVSVLLMIVDDTTQNNGKKRLALLNKI